eukprot:257718-Rhodomonas_salina.2
MRESTVPVQFVPGSRSLAFDIAALLRFIARAFSARCPVLTWETLRNQTRANTNLHATTRDVVLLILLSGDVGGAGQSCHRQRQLGTLRNQLLSTAFLAQTVLKTCLALGFGIEQPTIVLRIRDAMSSTDLCITPPILLRAFQPYAMSSTGIGYAATIRYAVCGTDIVYAARSHYAM